ncbi:winged helix-turn-helix transcriptional regulator [Methanofollis aquaemaris]|uniref:Winged helix-turn-helix transcriptional regulator n=1 Tax=Methanofollis aquaemaris TaxID=126734 RepID=A0A8A3S3K2_9EURY|nr:winged helix-turn-helix transcriptional regulator [Methanofollis aquaemaris]QSZ66728.1 winged helix-turn-helix transcriptional regulator [Methanofollis aquaemaris]
MQPKFVLFLIFALLLFSPGYQATAKIIVEPIPAEMPPDRISLDDEEIVPIWHLTPVKIVMCFALIYCPLLSCPVELFYSLSIWAYLGYRRASRHRPFDNPNRWQIFTCIRENPGISVTEIAAATGVSRGTVHYHLAYLQKRNLIHKNTEGNTIGYFAYTDDFDPTEEHILMHLKNKTKKSLLSLLIEKPGVTQTEAAEAIEVSRPTVAWHMERLIKDGVVESKKIKGRVRYQLTHDAWEMLEKEREGGRKEDTIDSGSATA